MTVVAVMPTPWGTSLKRFGKLLFGDMASNCDNGRIPLELSRKLSIDSAHGTRTGSAPEGMVSRQVNLLRQLVRCFGRTDAGTNLFQHIGQVRSLPPKRLRLAETAVTGHDYVDVPLRQLI